MNVKCPSGTCRRIFIALCALSLLFISLAFAQAGSVVAAVSIFCQALTGLLPVAAMLMIVIGAVIYAAGQVMGAETRARANVWATSCVVGAIMAILIVVITPSVMTMMYGSTVSCTGIAVTSSNCFGTSVQFGESADCKALLCSEYTNPNAECFSAAAANYCGSGELSQLYSYAPQCAAIFGSLSPSPGSDQAATCQSILSYYGSNTVCS